MTVTQTRQGGRRIELYLPFTFNNKRIAAIYLRPVRWDQSLRWQDGLYKTATDLLFEMADHPEEVMREIRYPDVERVLMQFMDLLPNEIRESIAEGRIPQIVQQEEPDLPVVDQPEPPPPSPEEPVSGPSGEYKEGDQKPWPSFPWPPGVEPPEKTEQVTASPKIEQKQPEGIGFEL